MINELNYKEYEDFLEKADLMLSDFWDSEWVRKKKKNNSKIFAMYDDFIEKKAEQDEKVRQEYKKVRKFLRKMEESANILKAVKAVKIVKAAIQSVDTVATTVSEEDHETLQENAEVVDQYFKPGSAEILKAMTDGFDGRTPERNPEQTEEQYKELCEEFRAIVALGSILSVLGDDYIVANEVRPALLDHLKDLNDYVMFREIERFNFNFEMDRDELNHNIAKFLYTSKLKAELMNTNVITRDKINDSRMKWANLDEAAEEMLRDPKLKEFIERFGMKSSNKLILKELREFTKGDGNGGGHVIHVQELERQVEIRQPERNRVPGQ